MFFEITKELISGITIAVFTAFSVHVIATIKNKERQILVWKSLEKHSAQINALLKHLFYLQNLAEISNTLCRYENKFFAEIRKCAIEKVKKSTNKEDIEKKVNFIYREKILIPYLEQNNFPLYNTIKYQLTTIKYHQDKFNGLLLLNSYMPRKLSILIQEFNHTLGDFYGDFDEAFQKLILCFENSKLLANIRDHERKFLTEFHEIELPTTGLHTAQKIAKLTNDMLSFLPNDYTKSNVLKLENIQKEEDLEYLKMWEGTLDKLEPETLARAVFKSQIENLETHPNS